MATEEITTIVIGERARKGDWCIVLCEPPAVLEPAPIAEAEADQGVVDIISLEFQAGPPSPPQAISISVTAEPDELIPRLSYRFYGHWQDHPKYGRQFVAKTFVKARPHGRSGVIRYLQQAPWVGLMVAQKLWDRFDADAVRILRESPDVASAAVGGSFTLERAQEAAAHLEEESALEGCSIDLMELLDKRGFPKRTAKRAVQAWGNRAAELIKQNPYLLMQFRGCGFTKTDQMYLDLGYPAGRMKRQAYSAWYYLASSTEGSTWFHVDQVVAGMRANVNAKELAAPAAFKLAKRGKLIDTRRDHLTNLYLAEYRKVRAERQLAEYVAEAMAEQSGVSWPDPTVIDVSEHQREELAKAFAGGSLALLVGGPGTGKSHSTGAVVKALIAALGERAVAVMAPTGKAAVRCAEAMREYGVSLTAKTIHSTLGVAKNDDADGWGFDHGPNNHLPKQVLVVDEGSMVDTTMMCAIFSARAKGTLVLIVGDPNQLPPVGHGRPLFDLIQASVSCGQLTEIWRFAGTIARACAEIRDGQPFTTDDTVDLDVVPPRNLRLIQALTPELQIQKMFAAIEVCKGMGVDPVWGCQVIVPVNAKSQLSRRELNQQLQRELNKSGQKCGSNPFLVGDKIVNTKNGFFRACDEDGTPQGANEVFCCNGELARVVAVDDTATIAKVDGQSNCIKISRGTKKEKEKDDEAEEEKTNTGCAWDLGYALSCHKAQGSGFEVAIVMVDEYPGARMVCDRGWVYTAISRAKRLCLIVGRKATADRFCLQNKMLQRKTFLVEQIAEQRELLRATEVDVVDVVEAVAS